MYVIMPNLIIAGKTVAELSRNFDSEDGLWGPELLRSLLSQISGRTVQGYGFYSESKISILY